MSTNIESKNNPLISIVIATYNEFFNIQKTIDSIVIQNNIEVIVIDGDSNDGTVDVIKKNSKIISIWISEQDLSIYDAWNKALDLASGDWIMFLGAGDCLHSNAIESYIHCINGDSSLNFISAKGAIVDSNDIYLRQFGKNLDKKLFLKNMSICHPSSLHHKSLFLTHGYFDTSYKFSADYEFLMRALKSISPKFIDKILVNVLDGGISAYSFKGLKETRRLKLKERSRLLVEWEWFVSVVKLCIRISFIKKRRF